MRKEFLDVLRAAVALQVAVYELADEPFSEVIAERGMDKCLVELNETVKRLKKSIR